MSNVLASDNFVSFLVDMGDEGVLGCHIPHVDAVLFAEKAMGLFDTNEYFPEIEFETEYMEIEGMGAGESVMFVCKNKNTQKKIQFAIEGQVCLTLVKKIGELAKEVEHFEPSKESRPWKFFSGSEKIAV